MTGPEFQILALSDQDRSSFESGVAPLDRYFQRQAGQDVRRRMTACYVAIESGSGDVAGFYTLSAAEIPINDAPGDLARKLPRYPTLPVARLGRLAVGKQFQGRKLGSTLLADAVLRAAQSDLAVFAMIVDAKDETAAAFYRHHGFVSYGSLANKLIAPIKALLPGP